MHFVTRVQKSFPCVSTSSDYCSSVQTNLSPLDWASSHVDFLVIPMTNKLKVRINKIISVCLAFHKQVPLAYMQSGRLSAVVTAFS